MNCTYCTDMETGRTIYGQRRQQPAGLASYQARKAAQEAASLAPYSVEKNSYYSSAPWIVKFDGKAIGEFFPTKKAAIAWIEEQKQKTTDNHSEQPAPAAEQQTETTDDHSEQKEEQKMKTYSEWLALGENRWSARDELQADVKTMKTIYRETHDDGPKKTAAAFVAAIGYNRAAAALGTLVNRHAWDGRISHRVSAWAAALPCSWDEEAARHFSVYADDVIHLANLDWLAVHFMQITPPDPDETPDDHSETTDETPAQDAEQTETTDDHSTQEQPAEQKEEKSMKKVEFAQDAIIVNGQEYAARYEYGETPRGHYLPTIRIYTALSGSACVVELPDDDSELSPAKLKTLIKKALPDRIHEKPDEDSCYVVLKVKMDKANNDDIRELEDLMNTKNAVLCKIQKIMPQTDVSTIVGSRQLKSLDDILNRDPMETLKEAYLIEHGIDMSEEQTALLTDLLNGIKNETND